MKAIPGAHRRPHRWKVDAMKYWKRRGTRAADRRRMQPEPETTPHRSTKNRKDWCGGHEGRGHVREIRLSKFWGAGSRQCGPGTSWWRGSDGWICYHERGCSRCGKIMWPWPTKHECPVWQELQLQAGRRQAALDTQEHRVFRACDRIDP